MELAYSTDYFNDSYGLKNSIDIIFKMINSIEVCINSIDDLKELNVIEDKINKNSNFCIYKISDNILDQLDHRGIIDILRTNVSPWNCISVNASKIYDYRKLWIDSFHKQLYVINDKLDMPKFINIVGNITNPNVHIGINLEKSANTLDIIPTSTNIVYRTNSIKNLNASIFESKSTVVICK